MVAAVFVVVDFVQNNIYYAKIICKNCWLDELSNESAITAIMHYIYYMYVHISFNDIRG